MKMKKHFCLKLAKSKLYEEVKYCRQVGVFLQFTHSHNAIVFLYIALCTT